MIYLDYAAHAPADPVVLERFCDMERRFTANPNSGHAAGRAAREQMACAAEQIASLTGAAPSEVIFTSGATEANNLAIKGIAQASRHIGRHIISTPLEHSSVSGSLTALQERGWEIDLLSIGRDGTVDPEEVRELLRPDTVLVALCAVDSELGTVQPVREIAELLAGYPNCRLHVDATQAIGRIPVNFSGIDTMSFAPHKFGGLCGSGILLKRSRMPLEPQMNGGASTTLYRSGTPALGLAASAALALQLACEQRENRCAVVRRHSERLRRALAAYPAVHINSPEHAVPHILNLSVKNVKGTVFQRALSEKGVCVSVKSACSADGLPSRAVFAVSRDRRNALSSWRISLSHLTTDEEIDAFLAIFDECYHELVK